MWKTGILLLWVSLFCSCYSIETATVEQIVIPRNFAEALNETRRILKGKNAVYTRPYMVYIRAAPQMGSQVTDPYWLCGGVIIHERYILTSAACIEQAQHFYVISGTNKWTPGNETNECIKNGAKKAIWKCVPKDYVFDGYQYDNIHWMIGDIAVVKVEEDFSFTRRIKGCDFVTKMIAYNNQTEDYEKPGTLCTTAGWGSTAAFSDEIKLNETAKNSEQLLETDVLVISKGNCKKRWPQRYHYIIDGSMICGKDSFDGDRMSKLCIENEVNCKQLAYSDESVEEDQNKGNYTRRLVVDPDNNNMTATAVLRSRDAVKKLVKDDARRIKQSNLDYGGFCENDHGGPLVKGQGSSATVVGVISACQTHAVNRRCYGPFLYTSVYKYRNLIACAIDKEIGIVCSKYLDGTSQTSFDWSQHPDGKTTMVVLHYVCLFYLITALCFIFEVSPASIEVATTLSPKIKSLLDRANVSSVKDLLQRNTRRILNGRQAGSERPYMVYLKLAPNNAKKQAYKTWLCGGVILHEEYILTSAACIEDVKHFYIVAGTSMYSPEDDNYTNPCIKNGARKAVWKCVPKNYVFDGHENDNIRWMNNDIAVVKVDEEFDFTRKVRGCEYIPRPICYNNESARHEAPESAASVAGWGSTDKYNDWVNRRQNGGEAVALLEADVTIMSKHICKKRWGHRYNNIIENYMICTKEMDSELSEICQEKYVECSDIAYDDEDEDASRRSLDGIGTGLEPLHSAHHSLTPTRREINGGGFCENDHGGPLVVGRGVDSMVIGIISACRVKEKTNHCYGPFLYTSVYKNRMLINCAIYKTGVDCNKKFRSGSTYLEEDLSWEGHPDGLSKHDVRRRMAEQEKLETPVNASESITDVKNEAKVNTSEPSTKSAVTESAIVSKSEAKVNKEPLKSTNV